MTVTRTRGVGFAGGAPGRSGLEGLLADAYWPMAACAAAAAQAATASDESGAVTVDVDGAGRVSRVMVADAWRHLVWRPKGADRQQRAAVDLGAAVLAATAAANVARLERWATAVSRAAVSASDCEGSSASAGVVASSATSPPTDRAIGPVLAPSAFAPSVRRAVVELADLTLRVWDEIDSRMEAMDSPVLARECVTGGGFVDVTVVAAQVCSVRADRLHLDARGDSIGAAITRAIRSAYREWDRRFPDPRIGPAAVELRDRLADPAMFLASLGLGPPPAGEVAPRRHWR